MKLNNTALANAVKRTGVRLAVTSGSVVLFSQVYFSTIGDGFRISAAPVIYPTFPVFLSLLLRRFLLLSRNKISN